MIKQATGGFLFCGNAIFLMPAPITRNSSSSFSLLAICRRFCRHQLGFTLRSLQYFARARSLCSSSCRTCVVISKVDLLPLLSLFRATLPLSSVRPTNRLPFIVSHRSSPLLAVARRCADFICPRRRAILRRQCKGHNQITPSIRFRIFPLNLPRVTPTV